MTTQITLQDEDRDVLSRVLHKYLGDLRMEIADTESHEMREQMHRDENIIKSLIERVGSIPSHPA